MTAKRNGDTLRLTLDGAEIREHLDSEQMWDTICERLEPDESMEAWALRDDVSITLTIDLDILAAPGQSEREIYLRENGVPLV